MILCQTICLSCRSMSFANVLLVQM